MTGQVVTFVMIAVCCIGAWLFVYKLLPETKGRSIESIVNEICPDVQAKIALKSKMDRSVTIDNDGNVLRGAENKHSDE